MIAYMYSGFQRSTSIHDRLALQLSKRIQEANHLNTWQKRKATLIQVDPSKEIITRNYRPITCLHLMWIMLTSPIREEINYSLVCNRRTKKLLLENKWNKWSIIYWPGHPQRSQNVEENVDKAGTDYKKTNDTVSQTLIIECLKK